MMKEEIKHFKPIINSMKLIREYCESHFSCATCIFDRSDKVEVCPLNYPEHWFCEVAIAALEEEEDSDDKRRD